MSKSKIIAILALGTLPALALAAGSHSSGHPSGNQHSGGDSAHTMPDSHAHGAGSSNGHSVATTVGRPGDPAKVDRVIEMTMDDTMRFAPDHITVKAGEIVRIFAKNTGQLPHELVIGSMPDLLVHAEMMRKMPDMKHAEPNQIALEPGQRGAIVWQFDQAGTVDFACLIPGHMEAGMVGSVQVD